MRELKCGVAETVEVDAPLALIVLDLDGLKEVNDRHGHAAGDDCLVRIGRLLRTELRPNDQAFRIGGDEFAILLPDTTAPGADEVTERLVEWLERSGRSSVLRVEASFGVAAIGAAHNTPEGLLRSADEAMYRSKNLRKLAR
jgi:diguanylate cyclase (GGDEF)-like protein